MTKIGRWFARHGGDLVTGVSAFLARAAAAVWAGERFPPAADGFYYHAIATRVAAGLGSTWLWPDGKVTYAAHYPIGYPALLALAYRLVGASAGVGAWVNAVLGAAAAVAVHRLARAAMQPRPALAAGLAVALHPGLVMYTPALMTEGVTAALIAIAAWAASLRTMRGAVVAGLVLGAATLVRPQSIVLAPCLGFLAADPAVPITLRLRRAGAATLVALLVCAPWSARNCVRMQRCALVSFNGGWNLLIGAADNANGSWTEVKAPDACRTVWDEAEKDICFGREARRLIASEPGRWIGLVPARLASTFDYAGAPGYYLHASNPAVFDDRAKVALGTVETLYERLAYLGALAFAGTVAGPRRRARLVVASVSGLLLFQVHAYLAVAGLALALVLLGWSLVTGPLLASATFFVVVATAAVHAVFFGAGRYSMVVFPLVTALGFAALTRPEKERDTTHS
jgi:4-amino-4-deoxy-L-arabinose transferase-like glycosyltransferase